MQLYQSVLLLVCFGTLLTKDNTTSRYHVEALPWESLLQSTYANRRHSRRTRPPFLARFNAQVWLAWNGTSITDHNVSSAAFVIDSDTDTSSFDDESDIYSDSDGDESLDAIAALSSDLSVLREKIKQTVTEQLRSIPSIKEVKEFLEERILVNQEEDEYSNENSEGTEECNSTTTNSTTTSEWKFLSRVLASTKTNKLANALAEQIRSTPQIKEFIQRRNFYRNSTTTGGFDWKGALADRLLSEDSAVAVKTILAILANMEDHGVVDVFSKYPSQDVAASLYALYRLQRASKLYETVQQLHEPSRHPEDLLDVLEDLSHFVLYATAAYGWKMDLAFKGKLHLGDQDALLRKTGIQKDDIVKLRLKSKAHRPAYFLVRDHRRRALVLCIRGTWSARDVLTDLCCTAEEYQSPCTNSEATRQRYCAHHGMLEAAMTVAIDIEDLIEEELKANPGYSLVLVGHSMGAGCCSLLATFWEEKFPNIKTYLFGGPCVAPLDSHPTNNTAIINVISEGDPFRCLSLGHIADNSAAVAHFCEEAKLRREILSRTEGHIDEMDMDDLQFCWEQMEELRSNVMTNPDKMFPPGRIFHVTKQFSRTRPKHLSDDYDSDSEEEDDTKVGPGERTAVIHEVGPEFFRELVIRPRMFDISRHLPSLYEDTLHHLIEIERQSQELNSASDQ